MRRESRRLTDSTLREIVRRLADEEARRFAGSMSADAIYLRTLWRIVNSTETFAGGEVVLPFLERMIEWIPSVNPESGEFQLLEGQSNPRKRNGSYYTPRPMIERLFDHTLDPVLDSKMTIKDILSLKVCDPSCGAGEFLIATVERVARRLDELEAGSETPNNGKRVDIITTVIQNCVYGVDKNPLAVELCRLRLEAMSAHPAHIRSTLKSHIRVADSLKGWSDGRSGFSWDSLIQQSYEREAECDVIERGFDVVLGNPPYLFGENKPKVDGAQYQLAKGQWDASWLFVELAVRHLLKKHGSLGFVLPDSILARTETKLVRELLSESFDTLEVEHAMTGFDAEVSVVLLSGRYTDDPRLVLHDGVHTRTIRVGERAELARMPWTHRASLCVDHEKGALRVGDIAEINRGEERGKKGLPSISEPCDPAIWIPVLSGEGVGDSHSEPKATHWMPKDELRKPLERYQSPKIVIVKTGETLRASIDRNSLVTLQSVYNMRLREDAPSWVSLEVLCEYLNSSDCNERYILPYTSGKGIFPQITIGMVREIGIPLSHRLNYP